MTLEQTTTDVLAWTTVVTTTKRHNKQHTLLFMGSIQNGKINANIPEAEDFDVKGGRPGSIIETEEELERKEEIFKEMEDGTRKYPKWINEYGDPEEDEPAVYDIDDPDNKYVDSSTLGTYDIFDLKARTEGEWYPELGDEDPNALKTDEFEYYDEKRNINPKTGIEEQWDPLLGSNHPFDERTIVSPIDSYMIADDTRNDTMLDPIFPENDVEIGYNEDIVKFRKSLQIIETYIDPFIESTGDVKNIPVHVAKWHGYPEVDSYPAKNYTNNRFTPPDKLTDFDSMKNPYRARKKAVELARSSNAEWLQPEKFVHYHKDIREPYEKHGTLCGTLRPGNLEPFEELIDTIQPVLDILGASVKLLSIENSGKVFRFHYYGLMKNRMGMEAWTKKLLVENTDLEEEDVTGVVFETGFRQRDPLYDGGDHWYKPY